MFKKIALVIAALAVSAPAFADRGHRDHRGHGYGHGHVRHVVVHKPHYVVHRAGRSCIARIYIALRRARSCSTSTHRPAPRPVYVVEQHNHVNPVAVLAGAVIGAAIVHHAVTGYWALFAVIRLNSALKPGGGE